MLPALRKTSPIRDAGRTGIGAFAMKTDDTPGTPVEDETRRPADLAESEARFRQLAETIREVFFLTDPQMTQMLYVSPAYEQTFGRSCESLYANPRSWAQAIHADDRERAFKEIAPEG